jgi:hypothetical protein
VVLIGSSHYNHGDFWEIKQIQNNLRALRDLLTTEGRGGFKPEHCHLISNPSNVKLLDDHLVDISREAEDVLLVYFSGHGLVDLGERELYLCMADTDPQRIYYTALAIRRIKAAFQQSGAQIKILVLDCCYSGRAIREMMMSDDTSLIGHQIEVSGVYTLASAPAYDVSIAEPDAEYTAFTGHLLSLLRDGIPGAGTLTLGATFPYLRRALVASNYPEPQQCVQATAGDLVLVRNSATAMVGPSPQVAVTIPPVDYGSPADLLDAPSGEGDTPGGLLPHRVMYCSRSESVGSAAAQRTAEHDARRSELIKRARQADQFQEGDADPDAMVTEFRKIVTEMIALTHSEHAEVLAARDLLAYWLGRAGNPKGAARMYERLAAARERDLGGDHEAVMATRHNQAHWTGVAGDSESAVALIQRVAAERKRVLGEDHPDTLLSLEGLAFWKGQAGEYAEAAKLYRALADQREWLLGDIDETVLETRYNLADWVGKAGRPAEAAEIYDDLAMRWDARSGTDSKNGIACREKGVYWKKRGHNEGN